MRIFFIILVLMQSASGYALPMNRNMTYQVLEGERLYRQHCVACHGGLYAGPEFSILSQLLYDQYFDEQYLKYVIRKGGQAIGKSNEMPPWEQKLSEEQIDALIAYIKSRRHSAMKYLQQFGDRPTRR